MNNNIFSEKPFKTYYDDLMNEIEKMNNDNYNRGDLIFKYREFKNHIINNFDYYNLINKEKENLKNEIDSYLSLVSGKITKKIIKYNGSDFLEKIGKNEILNNIVIFINQQNQLQPKNSLHSLKNVLKEQTLKNNDELKNNLYDFIMNGDDSIEFGIYLKKKDLEKILGIDLSSTDVKFFN